VAIAASYDASLAIEESNTEIAVRKILCYISLILVNVAFAIFIIDKFSTIFSIHLKNLVVAITSLIITNFPMLRHKISKRYWNPFNSK